MKKISIIIIVMLFGICNSNLLSQNIKDNTGETANPRESSKLGIHGMIGGPSIIFSVNMEYFVVPSLCIEFGGGLMAAYGGLKYHLGGNKDKNWTPFLGIIGVIMPEIKLFSESKGIVPGVYIPIGMQYIRDSGFSFAVEAAAMYSENIDNTFKPWAGIKFGYHF